MPHSVEHSRAVFPAIRDCLHRWGIYYYYYYDIFDRLTFKGE